MDLREIVEVAWIKAWYRINIVITICMLVPASFSQIRACELYITFVGFCFFAEGAEISSWAITGRISLIPLIANEFLLKVRKPCCVDVCLVGHSIDCGRVLVEIAVVVSLCYLHRWCSILAHAVWVSA